MMVSGEPAHLAAGSEIADRLVDASPIGMLMLDGDLRCVRINAAGAAMAGIAARAAQGLPLSQIFGKVELPPS